MYFFDDDIPSKYCRNSNTSFFVIVRPFMMMIFSKFLGFLSWDLFMVFFNGDLFLNAIEFLPIVCMNEASKFYFLYFDLIIGFKRI